MMMGPAPMIRTECMSVRFGIKPDNLKAFPSNCQFIFGGSKREKFGFWGIPAPGRRADLTADGSKTLFSGAMHHMHTACSRIKTQSPRLPESMKYNKSIALAACL